MGRHRRQPESVQPMKSKLFAVLLLALVFVAGPASARRPVPIIDHSDIAATASSAKTVTPGQVKHAITVRPPPKPCTTAPPALAAPASTGKPVTAGRVKQAIMVGAAAKGWTTAEQGDGQLLATVNVRGKHTVMVLIAYTSEKY